MAQYKLKQRGFYYFNSIPALDFLCGEERGVAVELQEQQES